MGALSIHRSGLEAALFQPALGSRTQGQGAISQPELGGIPPRSTWQIRMRNWRAKVERKGGGRSGTKSDLRCPLKSPVVWTGLVFGRPRAVSL